MRTELTKLHQRVETTFIYVTHDQVEAMTMATRIVVMNEGVEDGAAHLRDRERSHGSSGVEVVVLGPAS